MKIYLIVNAAILTTLLLAIACGQEKQEPKLATIEPQQQPTKVSTKTVFTSVPTSTASPTLAPIRKPRLPTNTPTQIPTHTPTQKQITTPVADSPTTVPPLIRSVEPTPAHTATPEPHTATPTSSYAEPQPTSTPTTNPSPTPSPMVSSQNPTQQPMATMQPNQQKTMHGNSQSESSRSGSESNSKIALKNLLIKNLGPFNDSDKSFGDLLFDAKFGSLVFDEFGRLHNKGQPDEYDNPTFEFRAPPDTLLIAPIDGVIARLEWQPSVHYTQDDWDIMIKPSMGSPWAVNVDHIVSIDCDRSGSRPPVCDLPIKIGGEEAAVGTRIRAGEIIGYIGNWSDSYNTGISGRTELTVSKYIGFGGDAINYCPTMMLDQEVDSNLNQKITNLMKQYEEWSGNDDVYAESDMVSPGCLYSAIEEIGGTGSGGKTKPIIEK